MTGWLAVRLYERPGIRRAVGVLAAVWCGAVWSLITAPTAAAAGMTAAMSWTGLRDSYGVPVGAYFVSVVPMAEAVREQGPDFTADPGSWGPAIMSSIVTSMTYTQLSAWLAFECAALIFIASAGIWFLKFALSAQWLAWLAAIAAPVVANLSALVDWLYVMPIALLVCCLVGGVIALTQAVGRGVGIIIGGFAVVLLASALLRDPVTELVSDNGVLGVGRSLGFAVAQGGLHNGPIAAGGPAAQLDVLGSWLCDVLVRQQIQLINFGMVVDDAGCAQVWNAAIMAGRVSGPAHAVSGCAPAALAHAQQLDAMTVGLFAMVIFVVLMVLFALVYVGCEVFRIGFKAFVNLLVIVVAVWVAVAPGPPRRFAGRTAAKLFIHGVEMFAATAGLGILVLIISGVSRGSVPGMVGMTHPLAKLFVMMVLAAAGAFGFRHLLHGFGDRGIPGPGRLVSAAIGGTVKTGYAMENLDYATRRGRGVWRTFSDGERQLRAGGDAVAGRPAAPGRRGHPPAQGGPQARPPDGRPPGGPRSVRPGSGMTPAQANRAARSGRSVALAGTAGRAAAAAAAPHVAAATVVAERVGARGRAVGGGVSGSAASGGSGAPGRRDGEASRDRPAGGWTAGAGQRGSPAAAAEEQGGRRLPRVPQPEAAPPGRTPHTQTGRE